jgi:hypothetical protein
MAEYGVEIAPFSKWEMSEVLDPIIGRSWWKWMRERDWLWPNFDAVPGAIGALCQLREEGHYLECVTAKPEWAEASVWKWMGKWRPPFHRVTITDLDTPKSEVTEADALVDDKLSNVREFHKAAGVGILFDHKGVHRQSTRGSDRLYWTEDWKGVMQTIHLEGDSW